MSQNNYIREYNKGAYKTVKIYIRKEEYGAVKERVKQLGFEKTGTYIKSLIDRDLKNANELSDNMGGGDGSF